MAYLLKKEGFNEFVEHLISDYDVVAPVDDNKDNMSRFKVLEKGDSKNVVFDIPLYPAKDFFLPRKERLIEFSKGELREAGYDPGKRKVFFMNRCDINAVHRNDLIMLSDPVDPYYKNKRENSILVEVPCRPKDHCSCTNIALIDCYDLRILEEKDTGNFILDAANEKGEELLRGLDLEKVEYEKPAVFEVKLKEVKADNKDVWQMYSQECFSCSACTVVCPTCMCFTIEGHLNIDCISGNKHREWASCQLESFTKVAGGYVFRKERGGRGKQRIHCKFIYFKEKFGYPRCVGCGRCNAACPVGINIYKYFEALK